jgi:hypothetical protein
LLAYDGDMTVTRLLLKSFESGDEGNTYTHTHAHAHAHAHAWKQSRVSD